MTITVHCSILFFPLVFSSSRATNIQNLAQQKTPKEEKKKKSCNPFVRLKKKKTPLYNHEPHYSRYNKKTRCRHLSCQKQASVSKNRGRERLKEWRVESNKRYGLCWRDAIVAFLQTCRFPQTGMHRRSSRPSSSPASLAKQRDLAVVRVA